MVALVSAADRAAPRRRQQLLRHLPVPRRAHRLVPRQPRREALPLLRLPGLRRRVHVRDGDRGARLHGGAGVAGRPVRRRARDRGRGPRGGRAPPAARAAVSRCSTRAAAYYARYLWEAARGRRRRASICSAGGCAEETLREFRVGYAPERLGPDAAGVAPGRLQRGGAARRSASPSARRRGRDRSTTGSASGSCSPRPTPAGGCVGFGARAMRDNQRAPSTSTPPTASSTTSARSCSGSTCARGRGAPGGADDPGRGLHRRARAAPGRAAQRGRDHGHLADRGAGARARAGR